MSSGCAEVPLVELLERTPSDARLSYEHSPTCHSMIPVGLHAQRAAAKIRELEAQLIEQGSRLDQSKRREIAWHLERNAAVHQLRELQGCPAGLADAVKLMREQRDAAVLRLSSRRNDARIKAVCDRLESSDPQFDDCADAVSLLVALQSELHQARGYFQWLRDCSDVEMRDGDAAREVARKALADPAPSAPSEEERP